MPKPAKAQIETALVVPIVGDAALMGRGVAEGRLLPVLILDTSRHPKVTELIRLHRHLPEGDVVSQWGGNVNGNRDTVSLSLQFVQPMEITFYLVFSIEKQAMLIDLMVAGGGVYLQAGAPGDRLTGNFDADRMRVELAGVGFRPVWDDILLTRMTVMFSKRFGMRKREARASAERMVENIREFTSMRMKP